MVVWTLVRFRRQPPTRILRSDRLIRAVTSTLGSAYVSKGVNAEGTSPAPTGLGFEESMQSLRAALLFVVCSAILVAQPTRPVVITSDIDRFWLAFDQIKATPDTSKHRGLITALFIDKGTPGLRAMMTARRYTAQGYLDAIRLYPRFWNSIRANTLRAPSLAAAIDTGIRQLRFIYPELRPAPVYFTIGALRSNGTTLDGQVLIGSEIALGDSATDTSELAPRFANIVTYMTTNPIRNVVQLNVHEYVHTQQRSYPYRLLHVSLSEGIAEFISVQATGKASTSPAIRYGREHTARVRDRFASILLSPSAIDWWLYNDTDNEFGIRDLGYYVGYAIAEGVYTQASSKRRAIKSLIELDYSSDESVAQIVDSSGFFTRPLTELIAAYEASRPTVTGVREFRNGATDVSPGLTRLTIDFSAPMDSAGRGFDFGPLGEAHVLSVRNVIGLGADRRSLVVEVALKPGSRHQVLLTDRFRTADGLPLQPYLIDVTTADR